ncbi:MAG: (d)CMP kinase [Candidatus Omnitrophica bacterium]|nr:(d)CMP kinase [Candidatus Omnitrophota bacterium]
MKPLVITIDGPSGTGKSTAARRLARRLGYLYLDTGAMYRAVALKALRAGASLKDRRRLAGLARSSRISFSRGSRQVRVLLDGTDVTLAIRRPEVSEAASVVATVPGVRRALVRQQQAIGAAGGIVAEGRDTGTVVFPGADLKVFLTATLAQRARRRFEELQSAGHRLSLAEVLREMRARDLRDRRRASSPLRRAKGAVLVDNTRLKSDQVLDKLSDYARRIIREGGGCLD